MSEKGYSADTGLVVAAPLSCVRCSHCTKRFKSRIAYFLHYRNAHKGTDPPIQRLKRGPKPKQGRRCYADLSNEEKMILLDKRKIKRREKSIALYSTKSMEELSETLSRVVNSVRGQIEKEEMRPECYYLYNQAIISSDIIRRQFWPVGDNLTSLHHSTVKSAQNRIKAFKEKNYIMLFKLEVVGKAYLAKMNFAGVELPTAADQEIREALDSYLETIEL
jgi:hypothetical protein